MTAAFAIPVYRHGKPLASVVRSLIPYGLPIIIVDDGNEGEDRALVAAAGELSELVTVVRLEKNGGKGKAMSAAARAALDRGMDHLFQLDADGQHDCTACGDFLAAAEENPDAIICGYPVYDETVPGYRKKGREFSNGWARIVSLDGRIKDVLCGFRIYPLFPHYADLLDRHACLDARMGYDVDILVHLLWRGVPLVNKGVRVTYPEDGISNFRMLRDNVRISLTFTRLFLGMLIRLPVLLWRVCRRRRG